MYIYPYNSETKQEFIKKFREEFGDYELTLLTEEKAWKWTYHDKLKESQLKIVNQRTIQPTEVVIDIETKEKEKLDLVIKKIDEDKINYYVYDTGGKGYHIHLFFPELEEYSLITRPTIKKIIILNYCKEADLQKISNRTTIALEHTPHRKSGVLKKLIHFKSAEVNNKIPKYILDNYKAGINKKNENSNAIIYPIGDTDFSLKIDFFEQKWFVEMCHYDSIFDVFSSSKDIIGNNRFKTILLDWIIGNDISLKFQKKSKTILMILLKDIKKIVDKIKQKTIPVTTVTTVTTVGQGGQAGKNIFFFFDQNLIPQKVSLAIGELNSEWYYGIKVPSEKTMIEEGNIIIKKEIVPLIITSKKQQIEPTQEWLEKNMLISLGEIQLGTKTWQLKEIKKYLEGKNEIITTHELYQKILKKNKEYIDFEEEETYIILTLWQIGTYIHPLFNAYPYLNFWGFKGSGKTRVLEVSNHICFNTRHYINPSPAVLFREISSESCTILLDETEDLFDNKNSSNENASEILGLLNAGWQKGASCPRMEKVDNNFVVKSYSVYSPKMMASIKGISGPLQTRSIDVVMIKSSGTTGRKDIEPNESDSEFNDIRNNCYLWAFQNWSEAKALYCSPFECLILPNEFKIFNRNLQVWRPLLVIAKMVDDNIYAFIGRYAERYCIDSVYDSDDNSWETIIRECVLKWVTSDVDCAYYVSDLMLLVDKCFVEREFYDFHNERQVVYKKVRPSSSYVGRFLWKLGFARYRKRGDKVAYFLCKKKIYALLSRGVVCPTVVTEAAVVTGKNSYSSSFSTGNEGQKIEEVMETNEIMINKKRSETNIISNLIETIPTKNSIGNEGVFLSKTAKKNLFEETKNNFKNYKSHKKIDIIKFLKEQKLSEEQAIRTIQRWSEKGKICSNKPEEITIIE